MTLEEAREKISMHAGRTESFFDGYRYALRCGFRDWRVSSKNLMKYLYA